MSTGLVNLGRLWSRPHPTRLYPHDKGIRARRATDVVALVSGVVGLLLVILGSDPPSELEKAVTEVALALPVSLTGIWLVVAGVLSLWAVFLVLAAILHWRLDIARDHLLALLGASALVVAVQSAVGDSTRSWWDAITATGPPAEPVSLRLALVVATTAVAAPHLARPYRAAGRWLVGIGAVSLVLLSATTPSGAVLGVLCGVVAATLVHLLLGSSGGRPSLDEVRNGLADLGVEVTSLSQRERQVTGVFVLDAIDATGRPLEVKVYGRDAHDAQLLAKAWRTLWYRDAAAATLTRLQQVEHEGFVTLLAHRRGAPTQEVVGAGRTSDDDAMIVLSARGTAVAPGPDALDPAALEAAWDTVLALGDAGIAHGDLAPANLRIDGDEAVLGGMAGAVVAPTGDQRRIDLGQLIVMSALLAGTEQAVATAEGRLGTDGMADVLPYLQGAGLGPGLRAALADADLDLEDLRQQVAVRAGIDEPELAKLRRVSIRSLVRTALIAAFAYFLISSLADVDFAQLVETFRDATPALLVAALLVGQVPRFPQAESVRAACPRPIAFGATALLEFAITFINLVAPATAAKVAMNIRFLQRQGIPPVSAASVGALDVLGGFAIQLLIIISVAVFGLGAAEFTLDQPATGDILLVLGVIAGVLLLVALLALVLPRVRNRVLDRIRPWIHEAGETLATLRSPARVARLLGANVATELMFACTLALVLKAFGWSLPLTTLLFINVSVTLFSGLMPVPGGIGVAEAALVAGLTAAGIPEAAALGTAIGYRICTFYLPPIWGSLALRRLERKGFL
ncbi:MAG: lysylphosphatidylglycerol synthase transmembrane domain-containing protein [Acidimicrobiia bacterium]